MASVKFGGGIIQASGSIAGVVHARNRFGNYIRPRTKPVNPNSSLQSVIRVALAFYTQRWHDTITATQRNAWNTYAYNVAMKNRLGESIYLTGFNMYLRSNIVRTQLGQSKCDAGPITLTLPEQDTTFAIAASAATNQVTITWDHTLPWTEIPASVMGVWCGRPKLITRNFFAGPWRMMGSIPGNQTTPQVMTCPFTLIAGQKIWCYGRVSTGPTDSRLSEPFRASCTIAA
jgi:hypothetical protein